LGAWNGPLGPYATPQWLKANKQSALQYAVHAVERPWK
jgi:hypothetical protein